MPYYLDNMAFLNHSIFHLNTSFIIGIINLGTSEYDSVYLINIGNIVLNTLICLFSVEIKSELKVKLAFGSC